MPAVSPQVLVQYPAKLFFKLPVNVSSLTGQCLWTTQLVLTAWQQPQEGDILQTNWLSMYSSKTLFAKAASGWIWSTACIFARPCTSFSTLLPHFLKSLFIYLYVHHVLSACMLRCQKRAPDVIIDGCKSHHAVAGTWTQDPWKNSQCS